MPRIWEDSVDRVWEDSVDREWEDYFPISYPVTITITQEIEGSISYWTKDGTDPDIYSNMYKGPFEVNSPVTEIRAFSKHPDYGESDITIEEL